MKILDRLVLREFRGAVIVAFSFFTLLYLALHFFTHLNDFGEAEQIFADRGQGLLVGVCRYYAVSLPFVVISAGPFALLLAGMWTAQRLARDAETVAAQAAGVSLRRLMAPVLIAGAILAGGLAVLRQEGLPRLTIERHRMERLLRGQARATLGSVMPLEDGKGLRILVESFEPATRVAFGVRIIDRENLGKTADVARMRHDGSRWIPLDPVRGDASLVGRTDLMPREIEIEARGLRQLRRSELKELILRAPDRRDLQVLWHAQYSYPAGGVVLMVLGLALVLRGDRRSVYAAAGLGILVSVVYFAFENVLHGVAQRELWLAPPLAAWLPPVVFGAAGATLYTDL